MPQFDSRDNFLVVNRLKDEAVESHLVEASALAARDKLQNHADTYGIYIEYAVLRKDLGQFKWNGNIPIIGDF